MNPSILGRIASFLNGFRGLFMPLGLLALVAAGIHAAADVLDDSVLRLIEGLDAHLDAVLARWELTQALVNAVDSHERTVAARGLMVGWELTADLLVAGPLLGYRESPPARWHVELPGEAPRGVRPSLDRLNREPTLLRLTWPAVTAVFVLGGAYAVYRLVEGTLFVGLVGDVASPAVAGALARGLAAAAMLTVLASLGWRAVLRAVEHADERSLGLTGWRARLTRGAAGAAVSIPLAVAMVGDLRSVVAVVL